MSVLIWSPLAFGAVYLSAQAVMSIGVFAASVLLAVSAIEKDWKTGEWQVRFPATGLNLIFLLFFVYLLFQLLPLPGPFLRFLSPEAWVVAQKAVPASQAVTAQSGDPPWSPIALYSDPVRQSLILWITYGLFFFCLTRVLNTRRRIDSAVIMILLLGVFEALYGVGQTFTGSDYVWWYKKPTHTTVSGTYVNRNHFAGLMGMIMVLGVLYAAALSEKRRRNTGGFHRKQHFRARITGWLSGEQRFNKMSFVLFAGAVTGIGLIFSASRGAMIAAAAALLLTGFLFTLRQSHRRKGFFVLTLFLIISVYATAIGVEQPLSRFESFYANMEDRARFWNHTLSLFRDYPVVGSGIGTFQYVYPKYQAPEDTRRFIEFAHNDWVQFLSEAGITGMVLLFTGMSYYLFHAFRSWQRRHDGFAVCLGMAPFAVLAGIGIHSWSDFNLHIPANFLMLSAILAVGHSAVHLPGTRGHNNAPPKRRAVPFKYGGAILLALFGCLLLWSGIWSLRHGVAEAYYYSSATAEKKSSGGPFAGPLESAVAWEPTNASYLHSLAMALQKVRYEEVINREKERKLGDSRIITVLEDAVRLNPLHAETHIRLAWEYTYLWNEPDSMKKWIPAADLSMERGAFFAGENNPYLHFWMGDYWLMRSKTVSPAHPQWEAMLARARWHFHKNLALETGNDRKRMMEQIRRYVWMHYPDVEFVKSMLSESRE